MKSLAHRLRRSMRSLGYDIARFPRETLEIHLEQVFERLRINCVLDVGAHHGEYGHLVRKLGFAGTIVSFEPVSSSFDALRETSASDPNWHAHSFALGAEESTMSINVSRYAVFSSFRQLSREAREREQDSVIERQETVEVRRLDAIFDDVVPLADPRVFLKVDTQGWDIEVLKGAEDCLSAIVGLQSEVAVRPTYDGAPTYLESIPFMTKLGFDLSGLFVVSRDEKLRLAELDCVLVRAT